jgi:hypothetical protein
MNTIKITANIRFFDNAATYFNFPVKNTIRASIWFKNIRESTAAEFMIDDRTVELNSTYQIVVNVIKKDLLLPNSTQTTHFT